MRFREYLWAARTLTIIVLAALPLFAQRKQGSLELHILNQTVEEGSWYSASPSAADLKPLCGRIELHAIYSEPAQSLTLAIDGIIVDERQETDARFIWDTKGWPDGEHQVAIQAADAEGNVLDTFSLSLDSRTITDTTPPVVSISFPPDRSVVRGVVKIEVQAKDDHDVALVWLEADGKKIGTREHFPYDFTWDTLKLENGSDHRLVAKAEDGSGNEGRSDNVTVQVMNLRELLKNPGFQGTPPSAWTQLGKCVLLPRAGGGCRIAPSPESLGAVGAGQSFKIDKSASGALLTIQIRLEEPSPVSAALPPPLFRVELWKEGNLLVYSWESPNPRTSYATLTETTLPLPPLDAGSYDLRLIAVSSALGQPRWEIARASILAP